MRYTRAPMPNPLNSIPPIPLKATELSDGDYNAFRELIYRHSRINLGENKKGLVNSRLGKRLRATGLSTFKEYLNHLNSRDGEVELTHFIDAISTNHTFFFRETGHYEFLTQTVLPRFLESSGEPVWSDRNLRIWSAACSTGEEPYSIAMTVHEPVFKLKHRDYTIQATDISNSVLKSANKGVFKYDRSQAIDEHLLRKYFQKGAGKNEGMVRAKDEIRRKINFQQLNLLSGSYPFRESFHVIFNRNVMIYFDLPTQQELINQMLPLMAPGGYLFIGHSESLNGLDHPLKQLQPSIYQKV